MYLIPNHLYIELTDKCNLSCRHCYINAVNHGENHLPVDSIIRIINEFATMGDSVTFSGGEPFLYDHLPSLVKVTTTKKLKTTIVTNALLLTDQMIQACKSSDITLAISIDGWREETHDRLRGKGTFEMVQKKLKKIENMNYQNKTIVCFVPTKENYLEFPSLVSSMMSRHFANFYVSPLENRGRGLNNASALSLDIGEKGKFLSILANMILQYENTANIDTGHLKFFFQRLIYNFQTDFDPIEGTIRISPDGNIFLTAYVDNDDFLMGNISKDSIHEICSGTKMRKVYEELIKRLSAGPPECRSCEYSSVCGGGSPARSIAKNDSLFSTDEFCEAKKVFLQKWYAACYD